MDELYAVGWRSASRPRQWVWSVFPSLGQAVRVACGYAACADGGRWRVYGTRVVAARTGTCGGSIRERSTTDCQADVCRACGLVRHTSYRTGQVVRYAGSGASMAYQR